MIGRETTAVTVLALALAASAPAFAQTGDRPVTSLPRGDYEAHWRQVDGPWLSQTRRTPLPGCDYPAHDACGKPGGGPFHAGTVIDYNAFGCTRPPIAVQCVVRRHGTMPAASLASGRWVLRTGAAAVVFDLDVAGNRFSGVSDRDMAAAQRDMIIDGRIRGRAITFTRLCQGRLTCVQRFTGTLSDGRADGSWTGAGTRRPVAWTLERE